MNVFRDRLLILTLALVHSAVCLPSVSADDKASPTVPRYQLQVGLELIYRGQDQFKYKEGQFLTRHVWNFWVVRENPDHSWRIIAQNTRSFKQSRGSGTVAETVEAIGKLFEKEEEDAQKQVQFGWFDIHPDGQIIDNPLLGYQLQPFNVLACLPRTSAEVEQGWKRSFDTINATVAQRLLPASTAELCSIECINDSPEHTIYGVEQRATVTFDRQRGLPTKIATDTKQTYGFEGKGTGTVELAEVKSHSKEWCETFLAESEKYFANADAYERAAKQREFSATEMKAALTKIEDELKQLAATLQSDELKKYVDQQVETRSRNQKYYIEAIEERQEVLGKASDEWQTTDLEGKDHALKDYRGKVVVLDFWYRGCGWCVRAMPQVKQVADHFKGQPVAVLGMNTDRKTADATFVVDKMGLNYVNLKAEGLPEKYKVSGFPTLIIIDQQGIVRDVHVGYSPDLKEQVIRSIEQLLATKP